MVLITGTNGKTTTTRLTEFICRRGAGLKSGYCSTDWVLVNGKVVSEGDLSGPSGHQLVLTHSKVEVAILEVARGGMIKRGLLPNYATAATVTNIAHDHIGQNGIENLSDLATAKGIVYAGLKADGIAIVNLDDPHICALNITVNKAFISTKLDEAAISAHLSADNFVVFIENGQVILKTLSERFVLNKINEIPLTVQGLAKYNYENVLHAVALAHSFAVKPKQIICGLAKFGADEKSNFGRWNYYNSPKYGRLVVDIAHNSAGLDSILTLAQQFRSLNQLVIKEFQTSLRGSELGEMPEVFKSELIKQGYPAEKIRVIPNELEAVQDILSRTRANDMYMLCSHEQLGAVSKLLRDKLAEKS